MLIIGINYLSFWLAAR